MRCVQTKPFKGKCDTCQFYNEGCKALEDLFYNFDKGRFERFMRIEK